MTAQIADSLKTNNRGVSALEFALCLPVLLTILFGILEYGWFFVNQIVLINSVSAGARAGIKANIMRGDDPIQLAIDTTRNTFWLPGSLNVSATVSDDEPVKLRVVAHIRFEPLTGYLPSQLLPSRIAAKAVLVFP